MRKIYKCSNIKFCMEDEHQRRTWEYLQGITRKDGSYGKILSDAFMAVLDGKNRAAAGECSIAGSEQSEAGLRKVEELLEGLLEDKLQRLQDNLAGQIEKCFQNCDFSSSAGIAESLEVDGENSMGRMQEPELSEDMMAFAFAMPERTAWNRIYIQEPLRDAYEKCFGQALRDYNAAQKRKDRQKDDYLKEIENSGNKKKIFYENIVQIGKKTDTSVVDENGVLTEGAKAAIEVLDQYARTFQERNPNLYLSNCVMHLDEATPHLHIDYIPVAHGYKNGMKTRNSLTKAFQQMGFAKAVSRKQNETVAWQEREREYLTELCREQGIEIEILGIQRDNLLLPEYKAAMREVEELEQQAAALDMQNEALERQNDDLTQQASELCGKVQEMEAHNDELLLQAQALAEQIEEAEVKEKEAKEILAKHDLRAETKGMKSAAVPISNLFGGEEYVKVKKNDWNKILDAFSKAVSRNHLLEKYEKKIAGLEQKIDVLSEQVEKLKRFVASKGLGEAFAEYVRSLAPKTMRQRLKDARSEADVHNRQRKLPERGKTEKSKQWQQEI